MIILTLMELSGVSIRSAGPLFAMSENAREFICLLAIWLAAFVLPCPTSTDGPARIKRIPCASWSNWLRKVVYQATANGTKSHISSWDGQQTERVRT